MVGLPPNEDVYNLALLVYKDLYKEQHGLELEESAVKVLEHDSRHARLQLGNFILSSFALDLAGEEYSNGLNVLRTLSDCPNVEKLIYEGMQKFGDTDIGWYITRTG